MRCFSSDVLQLLLKVGQKERKKERKKERERAVTCTVLIREEI